MATLLQSKVGGATASNETNTPPQTLPAVGFNSATIAGSLLVCVVWASDDSDDGSIVSIGTPVTAGITWTLAEGDAAFVPEGTTDGGSQRVSIFYSANSPSIAPAATTSVTVNSTFDNINGSFSLYEFGGIVTTSPVDTVATTGGDIPQETGVLIPQTPNLSTTTTDLIFMAFMGQWQEYAAGFEGWVAGTGFTRGLLPADAAVGGENTWDPAGLQYALGVSSGSIATAIGTDIEWVNSVAEDLPSAYIAAAVAFKVAGGGGSTPILDVSPPTLSFSATLGGSNPASQNVAISNGNGGTLAWTVSSDQSWLSASPSSGTGAESVAASVNIAGLAVGTYTGHMTVAAAGATDSPQTVTVTLTISNPPPTLSVSPLLLTFSGLMGAGNPPSEEATVSNVGVVESMPFTAVSDSAWLTTLPVSGDAGLAPVNLAVSVNLAGLADGSYTGHITVTAPGALDSPQVITVLLTNAAGVNNGVVLERRYTCNGIFDSSQKYGDVIRSLAMSMAGYAVPPGPSWEIYAGVYVAPTISLGDGDLRGPVKGDFRISARSICNGVKGTFIPAWLPINPSGPTVNAPAAPNWRETDFPPYQDAAAVAQDGGIPIWKDIKLDFTTSLWMAQRIAKILCEQLRRQQTISPQFKFYALQLIAGNVMEFTHSRWGLVAASYQVQSMVLTADAGEDKVPALGVDLVLRQTDAGVYYFSPPTSSTDYGDYSPYGSTGVGAGDVG